MEAALLRTSIALARVPQSVCLSPVPRLSIMHLSIFGDRLEIGLDGPLLVRREILRTTDACRLMYVSDIHLRRGRSQRLIRRLLDAIQPQAVDAVLLGGDLVDQISELDHLRDLVAKLARAAPLLAVGGNHDRWVGLSLVAAAVRDGGGQWIHDASVMLMCGARSIAISGPEAPMSAEGDVRVICAHFPSDWRRGRRHGVDLVLAGHLHGGQAVAFEHRDRLIPGNLFYPFCCLRRRSRKSHLIVSRGVSDLLPIRWRCPREVVLCHV